MANATPKSIGRMTGMGMKKRKDLRIGGPGSAGGGGGRGGKKPYSNTGTGNTADGGGKKPGGGTGVGNSKDDGKGKGGGRGLYVRRDQKRSR